MGDKTAIEWADATWNPTTGCDRVSPGCAHCYALDLAGRLKKMGQAAYQVDGDPRTSGPGFAVQLHEDRLELPLRWTRPRRIFVDSMSDLFHEQVPDHFVARVFTAMAIATRHTFQVLTKRPERMRGLLSEPGFVAALTAGGAMPWPLPNVWLGTSVENQTWAGRRIPELLATPAAVRFLSCEPLLGPLDLGVGLRVSWQCSGCGRYFAGRHRETCTHCGRVGYWTGSHAFNRPDSQTGPGIDWVIAGGESGPDHRPVDDRWVRSLRDQCVAASLPFMFKQWGGIRSKAGGRELDGRTWDEYPAVTRA